MSINQLREDALEMVSLLRGARCIDRHGVVSFDKAAELLTAIVTEGAVASRNNSGFDVLSPRFGKIEVKSRMLGTDGPFPRVSLTQNKIDVADWFMAVRWSQTKSLFAAVMLPRISAEELYIRRRQTSGKLAHIAWNDWSSADGRIEMTEQFRATLNTID